MSDDENTFEVNITETSRAPAWGIALAAQINAQYRSISKQINSVKADCSSISEQLADFKTKVQIDIQKIDEKATEALNTANTNKAAISANADTIKRLETELNRVNRKCNGLELENEKLTNQQESHESYSRRDNLLIRGIKEQQNETQETCIAAVRDVLIRDFKMEPDFVNKIVIVRCHRFGSSFAGGIDASFLRPMIVRFLNFNDRQAVWMRRFDLTNNSISISENFANNIEKRRRLLYPVVKKAKSLPNTNKVYLRGDKLIIDNKTYSIDNVDELPPELHPRQFSFKTNKDWIVFGGPQRVFNYMSNYYTAKMEYNGTMHDTLEHAYQYTKADRYNDIQSMNRLLCAKSAAEAKQIGFQIKNFQQADWDSVKTQVMEDLLRVKFSPQSELGERLKATTGKSLAEAGKSRSFSIGMSLTHSSLFDTTKWSVNGNLLGKALMKIRSELNNL